LIRSAALTVFFVSSSAFAQGDPLGFDADPASPAPTDDTPTQAEVVIEGEDKGIERWRTPVEALTERMIGQASKSIRFDWRKSVVQVGLQGSELLERNNFGSTRLGVVARKAIGDFIGEASVNYVFVWETDSSQKLALTPYRQFGRPPRFELDVNVAYAVAEGVVTQTLGFLPPAEIVFSLAGAGRYSLYPEALAGFEAVDYASLGLPVLSEKEIVNLNGSVLPGMVTDPARYGVLTGFVLDIYFQPGVFISPRALIAVPILAPATGSGLAFWWELTLGAGYAF